MKAFTLAALLTLPAGCAVGSNKPTWFVPQGFNLSECAPAVAAMADRWATGSMTTRFQTRATNRRGVNMFGWWNMNNIKQYLDSRGIKSQYVKSDTDLHYGAMGIYDTGQHFVAVTRIEGTMVRVGDPLSGVSLSSISAVKSSNASSVFLMVMK